MVEVVATETFVVVDPSVNSVIPLLPIQPLSSPFPQVNRSHDAEHRRVAEVDQVTVALASLALAGSCSGISRMKQLEFSWFRLGRRLAFLVQDDDLPNQQSPLLLARRNGLYLDVPRLAESRRMDLVALFVGCRHDKRRPTGSSYQLHKTTSFFWPVANLLRSFSSSTQHNATNQRKAIGFIQPPGHLI
jgi:hypothetical protein